MDVIAFGITRFPVIPLQFVKADAPMDMIRLVIMSSHVPVNLVQPLKALLPIEVTEFGRVNVQVKPVQPLKALLPMVVTELPMVRLVKAVLLLNEEV